MNFEDERYIRVYTRKTVTAKLIGWEGRTVLWHLMSEVDRAGVFDLGGEEPAEAIAAVADILIDVARVGMQRLLSRGVVERHGDALLIPRFIEAQEAKQSDKQRQRESRERRRDVTRRDSMLSHGVTDSHESEQSVTTGHTVSQPVTPYCAVPSRTEEPPVVPPSGGPQPSEPNQASKPRGKGGRRKTPGTPAPETLEPTQTELKLAAKNHVDLTEEIPKMLDFHRAKGTLMSDWLAGLRTWIRNAPTFRRDGKPPGREQHEQTRLPTNYKLFPVVAGPIGRRVLDPPKRKPLELKPLDLPPAQTPPDQAERERWEREFRSELEGKAS